jgi:PAS domain S-box-containing protein
MPDGRTATLHPEEGSLLPTDLRSIGDGAAWSLLAASPDFVYISPVDGPPVYLNPAVRRALGLSPTESIETLLEFRPPGFERFLREVIVPAAERDGSWRGRTDYVTRDGDVLSMSQVTVVGRSYGEAMWLYTISREITAVEHADQDLRQAEERTRFALEAAHAGVWEADLRTGRVIWSDTMRAVQGFADDEFAGTLDSFLALVHPEDRGAVSEVLGTSLDRPRDFNLEFRVFWPDGTLHWVASRGRVDADPHGRPMRVLAMAQDVTPRKDLEGQIQRAQRVEAIGQLAGGLAHDFNNYLTAVIGHAGFLEQDLDKDDPRRADAVQIRRAAERAADLTRQLLAFSRHQVLQPVPFDIHELVARIRGMLGRLLGEHIELVYDLGAAPPTIEADPGQIEQAIINVAVNARDAMDGGGTFTVSTALAGIDAPAGSRLALAPGRYLVLTLADTGCGIPPDIRHRIFEPFFTTKVRGRGTGLGLATVFGVVKQSGGAIEVESEEGAGTLFRIYLPACAQVAEVVDAGRSRAEIPRGNETILLVEDERAVRAIARIALSRQGYTILEASRPDEALALAGANERIDLLLSDIVMPGLSGPDLYRQLQAQRPTLRVLFMSGFADDAVLRHRLVDSGTAPFLPKPFSVSDLAARVREVLDGGPLDAEPSAD